MPVAAAALTELGLRLPAATPWGLTGAVDAAFSGLRDGLDMR